ncbi:MAG TPA: aldose epimerase family protein [Steroidobacteraceae bacterium]|nr:aldose epimerase family protein [Steroidobacteraceae bacterium]
MMKPWRLPDGRLVDRFTLGGKDGLQAEVLALGGILRSLTLPPTEKSGGRRIPLVLSLNQMTQYLADTSYLGQLVGRYGNRIGGAAFELDGKRYALTANNGANTLHGGETGFGKYLWKVLGSGGGKTSYVKLGHLSPAGTNGFPGNLEVTALISVFENTLTLAYEATTDAPTPISLTWHPYFALSGDPRTGIDEQVLTIAASHYLPVNKSRVTTGEIAPVDGTPFDFRKPKSVRVPPASAHPQIALATGFDHCWVLDKPSASSSGPVVAELYSPASGVRMSVKTNLPGLQIYDASHLKVAYPGLHALCLEPENFPNAPNHAHFPSSILRPGEIHRSFMSFSFSG